MRACVRGCVCVCVSVCVCVCVCVCVYGAVQSKHCGFDPRLVQSHTSFCSFSISGWLPTAKCVCLSMRVLSEKKYNYKKMNCRWPETATGSCVVQDQAPQQWWSIRSALQPDR